MRRASRPYRTQVVQFALCAPFNAMYLTARQVASDAVYDHAHTSGVVVSLIKLHVECATDDPFIESSRGCISLWHRGLEYFPGKLNPFSRFPF